MASRTRVEGPLFAYRAWKVRDSGLYSFSGRRAWPDDEPHAALCWKNFFAIGRGHRAPGSGCNCGLYAWRDLPQERYTPRGLRPVWGVVELVGKVAVHALGYRAQYARPVAVEYAPGVDAVAERYGLIVLESLSDWLRRT